MNSQTGHLPNGGIQPVETVYKEEHVNAQES